MQFDDDFSFLFIFGINILVEYNPILNVLSLIMIYLDSTLILTILNYEYIAAVLILIYVGAISVLILFIIMMYQINETEMDQIHIQYFGQVLSMKNKYLGLLFIFIIDSIYIFDKIVLFFYQGIQHSKLNLMSILNEQNIFVYRTEFLTIIDNVSNINNASNILYTYYSYPLIVIALFLFFVVSVCINLILKHN